MRTVYRYVTVVSTPSGVQHPQVAAGRHHHRRRRRRHRRRPNEEISEGIVKGRGYTYA